MKRAPQWRGLLWPDTYVTRFFFKNGLAADPGSVLDLGCGNGCNARLFTEYGWNVTGLDFDKAAIADARANWSDEDPATYAFSEWDLREGLPSFDRRFDALVCANSLYYFERAVLVDLLEQCRHVLAPGAHVFFQLRTPQDWRYGKGERIEPNTFRMNMSESNELDNTLAFYDPDDLVGLVETHLGPLSGRTVLRERYENVQHGLLVDNCNVIVWGRL